MIKAKKSLGQNFLIDKNILDKVTNSAIIKDQVILEIGPGTGNLTSCILKKNPKKLIVIEKDVQLAKKLDLSFGNQIHIINDDVLLINENFLSEELITVFGNLPYNISTEILIKWILNIKNKFWFKNLVLMFQKEVADRIIAQFNTSKYGRLSILSNWKLNVKKICDVSPNCFSPKPEIDSSLLHFTPKDNWVRIKDPKNIEKITRIFFNHRRKMLKKPFNQLFNGDKRILDKLKIDLNLRPQNLDLDTYYKLAYEYENLRG